MAGNITARVSTQPNTRNGVPQTRTVVKPVTAVMPGEDFIRKVALNYVSAYNANPKMAQDTPHREIMLWLLSNTYNPVNMADDDPDKAAYLAIKPLRPNSKPNIGAPRYLVRNGMVIPTPNNAFFIGDLMQIQADNVEISGWSGDAAINDIVLTSGFAIEFNKIVDKVNQNTAIKNLGNPVKRFDGVAHRDAIQIIPPVSKGNRYAAAISEDVTINGTVIKSSGGLQGIFATDGAFKNLTITGNHVAVGGEHALSINGLLSGKIEGNVTNRQIRLLPLRIGGGQNIYITGFRAGSEYSYAPLSQIAPSQANIVDERTKPIAGAKNYTNVDMNKFHQLASHYGSNYQYLMDALVAQKAAIPIP